MNAKKKDISKIFLDFGPYPMNRIWRKKHAADDDAGGIILPPDEDNYEKHGQDNLVIKYSEFKPALELDSITHKESAFYKRKLLEGELDKFVTELNEYLEPIKDSMLNLDRFSILFMFIGFAGTVVVAGLVGVLENVKYSFMIIALFVAVLFVVLSRNNREL